MLEFITDAQRTKKLDLQYMILKEDRIKIQAQFSSLRTIDELAKFLNTSKKQIIYYSLILPDEKKYHKFTIPKKSGTYREISAPSKTLKYIQKQLADKLQILYEPSNTAHGFIKRYKNSDNQIITPGIISNAQVHIRKKNILNIDLKDFFPTISKKRVYGLFKNQYSIHSKIAYYLTFLCCTENGLPQGAPTSPIITNMLCSRLDRKLKSLSSKNYVTYSRYVDDLSFSTSKNNFPNDFESNINKIIQEEGFNLNEKKRRLLIRENRLEVTGLTVNVKTNVQRKYIRSLRAIFNNIKKKGMQAAVRDYRNLKNITSDVNADSLKKYIKGKLEYLGQVKGKDDPIFIKFKHKFSDIFEPEKKNNKELKIESAEFIDKRNELLLKFNSDIVNTLSEENEELKNIRSRIKQKLDKARKILLSPDKDNYLETVYLLWYSCLNEFQKIHFIEKKERDEDDRIIFKTYLDGDSIDERNFYLKYLRTLPGFKGTSYITSERTEKQSNPPRGDNISYSVQVFLLKKRKGQNLVEFAWLNDIRNKLNLTHSDDFNIRKYLYSERVNWNQCSWMYQFLYFIFTNSRIPYDLIFQKNNYINNHFNENNMVITGVVKKIDKQNIGDFLTIYFNNQFYGSDHSIKVSIFKTYNIESDPRFVDKKAEKERIYKEYLDEKIIDGDTVQVTVRFYIGKENINNIEVLNIKKLSPPDFLAKEGDKK